MATNTQADPTVGGSKTYQGESAADPNELGAYIVPSEEFAVTADEAQIVYEQDIDTSKLSEAAKQFYEWNPPATNAETEESTPAQSAPPEEKQPEADKEPVYEPLPIDPTFLNLSEDYGVPDLAVDETDPDFQQFAAQMEKYLGHDFATYKAQRSELRKANQLRQDLEQQKLQTNVKRQEEYIKSKWKVDDAEYQTRMQKVVEVFSKLDKATQVLLDRDPNGALKLWKDIQATEQVTSPNVPKFEKSSPTATSGASAGKPLFTRSQIERMTDSEKSALWSKITTASKQGLVDWSK